MATTFIVRPAPAAVDSKARFILVANGGLVARSSSRRGLAAWAKQSPAVRGSYALFRASLRYPGGWVQLGGIRRKAAA